MNSYFSSTNGGIDRIIITGQITFIRTDIEFVLSVTLLSIVVLNGSEMNSFGLLVVILTVV